MINYSRSPKVGLNAHGAPKFDAIGKLGRLLGLWMLVGAVFAALPAGAQSSGESACSTRFGPSHRSYNVGYNSTYDSRRALDFYRDAMGKGIVVTFEEENQNYYSSPWLQRLGLLELRPLQTPNGQFPGYLCGYAGALERLDERMNRLGRQHPYVQSWAKNQTIVFSNCESYLETVALPVSPGPQESEIALMAAADFAYQTASAYFYAREWSQAAQLYQAIYGDERSPYQALAGYMVARALMYDQNPREAEQQLRTLLADPAAREVHLDAQTLLDIAAYRTGDLKLLTDQLSRIASLLDLPAEEIAQSELLVKKYRQAVVDLRWFPLYLSRDLPVDWWISQVSIEDNARAEATREVARTSDLVDWLQTMSASMFFTRHGWISLHSVRVQSAGYDAVTEHAAAKWRETLAVHWALATMMRAKPSDPVAEEVLSYFDEVHSRLVGCTDLFGDQEIYPHLLYHSVRLLAMDGKVDRAIELMEGHKKGEYGVWLQQTYMDLFRWLLGRGDIESARRLDALFQDQKYWRSDAGVIQLRQIIAVDLDDFMEKGYRQPVSYRSAAVINLLPVSLLNQLIDSPYLTSWDKAGLARMAWTRALLLDRDDLFDDLTMKLRTLNRSLDLHFDRIDASYSPRERRNLLTYILLETPRLGTRFNAQPSQLSASFASSDPGLFDIDSNNPNDNNWWCRFDKSKYLQSVQGAFFDSMVWPQGLRRSQRLEFPESEIQSQRAIRDRVLANHPVLKLIDEKELAALSKIESGPIYLGRRVLDWVDEEWWTSWLFGDDPLLPKALHLTVRATRYGCRINGRYEEVSRPAYRILHDWYPDSPWAELTPYWYGVRL